MTHSQRFNEFILEFEADAELIKLPNHSRLGLLLSNSSGKLKIKLLPDRLNKAVEKCRIAYLLEEDDKKNATGLTRRKHVHIATSLKDNLKCINCKNFCHEVSECLLRACGKCQRFNVGNKSDECHLHDDNRNKSNHTEVPNNGRFPANRGRGRNQNRGHGHANQFRGRGDRDNQQAPRDRGDYHQHDNKD